MIGAKKLLRGCGQMILVFGDSGERGKEKFDEIGRSRCGEKEDLPGKRIFILGEDAIYWEGRGLRGTKGRKMVKP